MQKTDFEGQFTKQSRPLVHALIISVALNLGLLATFITFILHEKKIETLLTTQTISNPIDRFSPLCRTNTEVLEEMEKASFSTLIQMLKDEEQLEQGYRKRDLALGCLVTYHDFDLARALPGMELERRVFAYSELGKVIELIPGLDQEQLQIVYYFAKVEKWPLTSKGLFKKMKQYGESIPDSLREAFFLSKEFYEIERAFNRLPFVVTKEMLFHLLLDGSWEFIQKAIAEIGLHPTGEIVSLGAFLASFENSKLASYLLVTFDPDYAYTQFSNERLLSFIALLDQKTKEALTFLNRLITSLRPEKVRSMASDKVKSWEGENLMQADDYVIQRGDSLWSLSRQFGISVERLSKLNDLKSDVLTPGQVLRIPKENQLHQGAMDGTYKGV